MVTAIRNKNVCRSIGNIPKNLIFLAANNSFKVHGCIAKLWHILITNCDAYSIVFSDHNIFNVRSQH